MDVTTQFGTVKIKLLKGEQGDQGETGSFEQLTQEQQNEIAEYVGERALALSLQSLAGTYVTSASSTSTIQVPMSGFTAGDVLFVFVEGLLLVEDVDYTLSGDTITLASPITHSGTTVHFRAIHATWEAS